MSIAMVHALFVGIPLLIVLILAGLIYSGRNPHPATYKLSEPWTRDPILWTAVDERVGAHHGHGSHELKVGGGASGKW